MALSNREVRIREREIFDLIRRSPLLLEELDAVRCFLEAILEVGVLKVSPGAIFTALGLPDRRLPPLGVSHQLTVDYGNDVYTGIQIPDWPEYHEMLNLTPVETPRLKGTRTFNFSGFRDVKVTEDGEPQISGYQLLERLTARGLAGLDLSVLEACRAQPGKAPHQWKDEQSRCFWGTRMIDNRNRQYVACLIWSAMRRQFERVFVCLEQQLTGIIAATYLTETATSTASRAA